MGVSSVVVERIFYNLLGNALKYSARATAGDRSGRRNFSGRSGALRARQRRGLGCRQSDRLFREFSRLETAGEADGFGLGLSLVARLVRAHGGRIWAKGEVGAGATFYVLLPAPAAEVPADANTATSAS